MSRTKRTDRGPKHTGHYYYDKKTKQHQWTIEFKGERHRIKDRSEAAARDRFAELKRKLFGGTDVKGAQTLVKDYLPRYINTEVSGKQSTIDDYHKRAELYIIPTFGEWTIEAIKRRHIIAWVNGMMNDPHPDTGRYWARGSVKQALGLLRRALDAAIPEFLEHNPAAGIKVPMHRKGDEYKIDVQPAQSKIFTAEQMAHFLTEVLKTDHLHGLYVYYVLLAEIGPRRGEGLGLRRQDIDFDHKTIRIAQQITRNPLTNEVRITTPKTDAGIRELPLSDETIALLREQCLRVGAWARPDALIFPGKDGQRRQPNSVTQHIRRTCRRLGFEDGYTLHSLRKYAITAMRADGVDLEIAASLAGHKGIKVTAETYSQPTMERKRAAVDRKKKTS